MEGGLEPLKLPTCRPGSRSSSEGPLCLTQSILSKRERTGEQGHLRTPEVGLPLRVDCRFLQRFASALLWDSVSCVLVSSHSAAEELPAVAGAQLRFMAGVTVG